MRSFRQAGRRAHPHRNIPIHILRPADLHLSGLSFGASLIEDRQNNFNDRATAPLFFVTFTLGFKAQLKVGDDRGGGRDTILMGKGDKPLARRLNIKTGFNGAFFNEA